MSSTNDNKEALRERVLTLRSNMEVEDWRVKSDQIISSLKKTDIYKAAKTTHVYISMNERFEVCTDKLIEDLLDSDKRVVVPITNFDSLTLSHSEITSISDLKKNKWGVSEPAEISPVKVSELDLIIVPMVAADRSRNRLGYGKGFYDRFLAQAGAKKVGLIFDAFLFDEIPTEEFDEKLDVIISEEEVIFA